MLFAMDSHELSKHIAYDLFSEKKGKKLENQIAK